jgi:hypothetical protein
MFIQLLITGILFLLMIFSGVILSRKGRPYKKGLFTLHKLFTLVTIVLMIISLVNYLKVASSGTLLIAAIIITLAMILISFVTGVLLSFEKEMPSFVTKTHRVSSALVIVTVIVTIWMILGN